MRLAGPDCSGLFKRLFTGTWYSGATLQPVVPLLCIPLARGSWINWLNYCDIL